jgi:hypothetical protein
MLEFRLRDDEIRIGPHRAISFQRTLRIPDDGGLHPLPPGLGRFPLRAHGDEIVLPIYRREALWISFGGSWWRPSAVKVGVGGVNAISGEPLDSEIRPGRQDYVVCPDQPWLDGINAGDGMIRQFVGVRIGDGASVEGRLTGREDVGGIQLVVIEPKRGLFLDAPPRRAPGRASGDLHAFSLPDMAVGVGGRMRQEIFPDDHGWRTWDTTRAGRAAVRMVGVGEWTALTGLRPPPTPVSARAYTEAGLPWFELYSERGDIAAPERLRGVLSDEEMRRRRAIEEHLSVPPSQVRVIQGDG